jgi:anti-sigma factor RsiW
MAEAYVLNRLSPPELETYEQHLLICEECRVAVEEADNFIRLFRAAIRDAAH